MPRSIQAAYLELNGTLKPQRGGTCGLYSFWFATLLLSAIDPHHHPLVYPRKHMHGPGQSKGTPATTGESIRSFAKSAASSGQGEVLSCDEMVKIISHFGYDSDCHVAAAGRETFVEKSIRANHPILFPYMFGGPLGPLTSLPVGSGIVPGMHYGPHWSLIIDEGADVYACVEPNDPTNYKVWLKEAVLKSNSIVDSYKYDQYWSKNPWYSMPTMPGWPAKNPSTKKAQWYDIGEKSRQTLANVLIAVL